MTRRRLLSTAVLVLGLLLWRAYQHTLEAPASTAPAAPTVERTEGADGVTLAFRDHRTDLPVAGTGVVTRLLADDRDGARHQRFLLGTPGGTTVLVAHNIDLAPRLAPLAVGDTVQFAGEYVWNERGGVLHWTHHDPAGRHPAGHLTAHGRTVE